MAEILKIFTPEQLTNLMRDKIIADDVGLTNFNIGSRNLSLLEAVGLVESMTGFDYLDGLRKSIPIALYDGLKFTRKGATISTGFLRFYRLPEFTIEYTGADSSVLLTVTPTEITLTTSGTPADDLTLSFGTYTTTSAIRTQINNHGSYNSILIGLGTAASDTIYQYTNKEIVDSKDHLDNDGRDVMVGVAGLVSIVNGSRASVDSLLFHTNSSGEIAAGDATSPAISAEALIVGKDGNILADAIDTQNGKGVLVTGISGVEYVINDSTFSGGTNQESDDERAIRFQIFVQGLHGSTVRGIESEVLKLVFIKSVTVREKYPLPGINTIVADDGSGNLSSSQITEIKELLDGDPNDFVNKPGFRAAGITINVQAPIVIAQNVTLIVTRIGTLSDSAEIINVVQSAIENYINTRKLGDNVILAEIIRIAKSAHPAAFDVSVSVPTGNVSIDVAELARVGSGTGAVVTVTVTTLPSVP